MPKISVIVPIYNVEKYLDKCLDSCLNQSFRDIEIICVNDGSQDNSIKIIEQYQRKDNRFICINKKNEGLLLARKSGINIAKGDYIFHLDGDDYLPKNALELLYEKALLTGADIVRGNANHVTEDGAYISTFKYPYFDNLTGLQFLSYMLRYSYHSIWAALVKKECYVSNFIYPENVSIGEDLIYMSQLSLFAHKVTYIEAVVYYYIKRGNSMINSEQKENIQCQCDRYDQYVNFCCALDSILVTYKSEFSEEVSNQLQLYLNDRIDERLFSLPIKIKERKRIVFSLYKKYFLFNIQVQKLVFKRSWKCYLSQLYKVRFL